MAPPSASLPFDTRALAGVRVLIVDDEPVLASTFCLVLQLAGAVAQSAGDGLEALATLATHTFDVILCDRQMPRMTGPEFLRELHRQGHTTPRLLFTNQGDAASANEAAELHLAGTLTKPVLPADLIAAIQRAAKAPQRDANAPTSR